MTREDALEKAIHYSKVYHSICVDAEGFWGAVIEALSQEPTKEEQALLQKWRDNRGIGIEDFEDAMNALQEPCTNAVSREAAIIQISWDFPNLELPKIKESLDKLPSVNPQKSGKWINDKNDIPICSQCGYIPQYDRAIDDYEYSNYCPSCGCRMVEPQESEVEE